ncbi:cytochrome c oxidase assembly protein [Actinoplanes sp. NPDC023714]|uniref:cytochrome c oxidase assembly protein n=1 Tax=Actinoplanes sp. NPDC023714 TaxID=3154322 RepID=UPI0033E8228B
MSHPHHLDLALLVMAAAIGYELLAARVPDWPPRRTLFFLAGAALLVAGLTLEAAGFRAHMLQHLLIGMLAPLGLVLGAPVTLLLRTSPRPVARLIGRALRHRAVHLVANPVTALALNLGGLAVLHVTPLYAATTRDPALATLVHVHFVLSGYLFAWVVAGPDPAPRRPSVPARLVVLGVAVAFHSIFSQLLYAGVIDVPAAAEERRGGAELMYYGGDIAELLLAAALVSGWRPRRQGVKTARTQSSSLSLNIR